MNFRLPAIVLASALAAGANPFSIPDGGSGFKLLKTLTTPRSQALSGAGAAQPGTDPGANPAIDSTDRMALSAGWVQSYGQFQGSYQEADWILPSDSWSWMGRARYAGFGDIPGRDESAQSTGSYSASSWSLEGGLSAPLPVLEGLRGGFLVGGGMDEVSDATSNGGWFSAGLNWAPGSLPFAAGVSVRNLGHGSVSGNDPERLPATVQMGVSWKGQWGDWTVVPMADLLLVADADPTTPVGVEVRWNGAMLRAGFPLGQPEARPSFGFGYLGEAWGVDAGLGWHAALGFAPSGRLTFRF